MRIFKNSLECNFYEWINGLPRDSFICVVVVTECFWKSGRAWTLAAWPTIKLAVNTYSANHGEESVRHRTTLPHWVNNVLVKRISRSILYALTHLHIYNQVNVHWSHRPCPKYKFWVRMMHTDFFIEPVLLICYLRFVAKLVYYTFLVTCIS